MIKIGNNYYERISSACVIKSKLNILHYDIAINGIPMGYDFMTEDEAAKYLKNSLYCS